MARWVALLTMIAPVLATAQELKVGLVESGGAVVATKDTPASFANGTTGSTLTITCSANVDCKAKPPAAKFGSDDVRLTPDSAADPKKFTGSIKPGAGKLVIGRGDEEIATIGVAAAGGGALPVGSGRRLVTGQSSTLQDLIPVPPDCLQAALARVKTTPIYDESKKTARVAVTVLGAPLTPLPESIAETDTLEITVIGDATLLQYVTARRVTPTRALGGVTIVGGDVSFPVTSLHARIEDEDSRCAGVAAIPFDVNGFAPGTGEIDIVAVTSNGTEITLGKVEIPVAARYAGMFSIGALWTNVQDPEFRLGSNAAGSIVTRGELGGWRLKYTLLYTPFVWGRRNLERPEPWRSAWYKHLNPSVGIVLNDVKDNGVVGASFDLGEAFVLTYGLIVSHVTELDPNAGVVEGAAVSATSVPTAKRWKTGHFWAVSIDLRAAVQFIKAAVGSSK